MTFNVLKINWKISSLVFYIAASVIWWFSLIPTLGSRVIGLGGDPYQSLWRFLRFSEVVVKGSLTIPEESAFKNFGPLPWLPLKFLFGEVVAYNLVWFITGILGAWFTFLLAKKLGARNFPSFMAGLLILFSPYRLSQALGHFGAMQLWWVPAIGYFFIKWQRTSKKIWLVWSLLCFVGLAWSEHYLFLALTITATLTLFFHWKSVLERFRKDWVAILFLVLAVIIAFYPFLPSLNSLTNPSSELNLGQEQRERYSATLKSFVSLPSFSVFKNEGFGNLNNNVSDHTFYLGIILPVLTLIMFTRRRRKNVWLLGLTILTFAILALGPTINIGNLEIPTPVRMFQEWPILASIRAYGRFVAIPVLFLPVLLAINWPVWGKRFSLALGMLLLLEIMPQFTFPSMAASDATYEKIYSSILSGKILAVPSSTNYFFASQQLYWSAKYEKELVDSIALERVVSKDGRKIFLQTPVVRDLALLRIKDFSLPSFFGQNSSSVAPVAFASQNIGTIVFDTKAEGGIISYAENKPRELSKEEINEVRNFLKINLGLNEIDYEDGIYVYQIPKNTGENMVGIRGDGWELLEKSKTSEIVSVDSGANFYVYASKDLKLKLSFTVLETGNNSAVTLVENGSELETGVSDNEKVVIILDASTGLNEYSVKLDGGKLKVENPKIQEI